MGSTLYRRVVLIVVILQYSCVMITSAINISPPSNYTDLEALIAFKSEIKLDPYNALGSNWTETENFCNWIGVFCSRRRQRVTLLSLGSMALQGTISPHVGNLSFLVGLDLSNNSFHGRLVPEIGRLRRLRGLILEDNKLEGEIPASIQQCQKLKVLSLNYNELTGVIPAWLSNFSSLTTLFLGQNNFTGTIPASFGNISNLGWLGLGENHLHGSIPDEMGNLQTMHVISLGHNDLSGSIPPSIFNLSSMTQIFLSYNSLSGTLPSTLGLWLPNLQQLLIEVNQLTGNIPLYLSNCSYLTKLILTSNQFTGVVPASLGHLQRLQILILAGNELTGLIPKEIGFLENMNLLYLAGNNLAGSIPSTIKGMKSLQRLFLSGNQLQQNIPSEICLLSNLGEMDLGYNNLSGSIPSCIGNLRFMQTLILSSNSLSSSIPSSLWGLQNLLFLDFSNNSLSGSLDANMRALKMLQTMDLSWNNISGKIPTSLGSFQSLYTLNLSRNSFWGSIPQPLGQMIALDYMDLSHNNLSGPIPKSLVALSHLQYLNLSFNELSGEIPSEGPFANFTAASFMENEALCGQKVFQVPPCKTQGVQKSKARSLLKVVLPVIIASVLSILIALILIIIKYQKKNVAIVNSVGVLPSVEHRMISYQELRRATGNLSQANLLGVGSFGSVFKGVLLDGTTVAVKVLNLQVEGAFKSFDAECKVLARVRHRNLVKVITSCSNPELRALVLQYMPNGSLEKWLYSFNNFLSFSQRVSIMMDVALALEYLHHGQSEPVVHCDLKPSNVLLDEEMTAHVSDFGIAKILAENETTTQTKTIGTLGYVAPEYGSEGRVSTRGDIYSYGVMLLEMLTRKKPTHDMFDAELSLRKWVMISIPDQIMEIIDDNLLRAGDGRGATEADLLTIFQLALECSREFPEERIDIKEVVVKLNNIKLQLSSYS